MEWITIILICFLILASPIILFMSLWLICLIIGLPLAIIELLGLKNIKFEENHTICPKCGALDSIKDLSYTIDGDRYNDSTWHFIIGCSQCDYIVEERISR